MRYSGNPLVSSPSWEEAALGSFRRKAGFGEGMQRGFALDDAVAFRRMMLELYQGRCAVTGRAPAEAGASEALDVFLLQPLGHGGVMRPGNALVVEAAVASLLGKGLVWISDDYRAYAPFPEVIGAAGEPGDQKGRPLCLPKDVALWPERTMIAYHRSLFRAQ